MRVRAGCARVRFGEVQCGRENARASEQGGTEWGVCGRPPVRGHASHAAGVFVRVGVGDWVGLSDARAAKGAHESPRPLLPRDLCDGARADPTVEAGPLPMSGLV